MQIQGNYLPPGALKYTSGGASPAAEEKNQIKNAKGLLFELSVSNVTTTDRYLWLFDNTSAAGAIAFPPVKIAAGQTISFSGMFEPFDNGLYFASSSTHGTYTGSGTADLIVVARYK